MGTSHTTQQECVICDNLTLRKQKKAPSNAISCQATKQVTVEETYVRMAHTIYISTCFTRAAVYKQDSEKTKWKTCS